MLMEQKDMCFHSYFLLVSNTNNGIIYIENVKKYVQKYNLKISAVHLLTSLCSERLVWHKHTWVLRWYF